MHEAYMGEELRIADGTAVAIRSVKRPCGIRPANEAMGRLSLFEGSTEVPSVAPSK